MKNIGIVLFAAVLLSISGFVSAQKYNPKPNWKDSYAVGGKCYCDTNGFDHGLDKKSASTPIGTLKVTKICADIKSKLGTGPSKGRIPYNDIQCGNGPANDAADEKGCPGRVDQGPSGCNKIGPKWDLAAVYDKNNNGGGNKYTAKATRNTGSAKFAVDGKTKTRYTTKQRQQKGQSLIVDLKSKKKFRQITLDAGSKNDYPRDYVVHVSNNGKNWGKAVASGKGKSRITKINFSQRNARYIRVTQRGSHVKYWWSVAEFSIKN